MSDYEIISVCMKTMELLLIVLVAIIGIKRK